MELHAFRHNQIAKLCSLPSLFIMVHIYCDIVPLLSQHCPSYFYLTSMCTRQIVKKQVERYWHSTRKQRRSALPPYIVYAANKEGHPIGFTGFSISLNGSQSLGKHESIAFEVPCHMEPHPPLPEPNTIKIIREMYTKDSPIVEALSGNRDCSLDSGDANSLTLLCEISFHLYRWENLGQHLGMAAQDVEVIKCNYERSTYFHEPAFQLLAKWLKSTKTPTLKKIKDSLLCIQFRLQLSTWTTSYHSITRSIHDIHIPYLANHIQRHWRSIARLLGESEANIDAAIQHERDYTILEQACYMIEQWKTRVIDDGSCHYTAAQLTTMDIFNGLHCLNEHIYDESLENALKLFM